MMMKLLIFVFIASLFQANVCQMAGGWSEVSDTNSTDFQKISNFAAEELTVRLNSDYRMRRIEVLSARKQVVAGINYKIAMRIGSTECKVRDNTSTDINECGFLHCGAIQKCNATVWSRPWLQDTRLTDFSCEKETDACAE